MRLPSLLRLLMPSYLRLNLFGIDDLLLGGVATALFGGGAAATAGTLASGFLNNSAASSRQDDQQAFNAEQYATRYQTTVKDMQSAGLNPMLAYTQGVGNAPSSSIASSSGYGDLGETLTKSKIASAQVANLQADTANKAAQGDLYEAQAANQWASAGQSNEMVKQIEANTRLIEEQIKNAPTEGMRLFYAAKELMTQADLNVQKGMSEGASRQVMSATAAKLVNEGLLTGYDVQAAQSMDNLGRNARQVKPALDILRNLMRK